MRSAKMQYVWTITNKIIQYRSFIVLRRAREIVIAILLSSFVGSSALADIVLGSSLPGISNNVTVTELDLTKPQDTLVGDLLLANIVFNGGSSETISAPEGWILIRRTDNAAKITIASYYKIATQSDPPTFSWNITPQSSAAGGITRIGGVDAAAAIDTLADAVGHGTSATAPSITTSAADEIITLYAIDIGKQNSGGFSTASGMTTLYQAVNAPSGPTTAVQALAQNVAGAAGPFTASASQGGQGDWAAQTIAFQKGSIAQTYAASFQGGYPNSILTGTANPPGSPSLVIVSVYDNLNLATSATYGVVPMTAVAPPIECPTNGCGASVFYLENPPTGLQEVVVAKGSDNIDVEVVAYTGTDISTPSASIGTVFTGSGPVGGTPLTATIVTAPDSWLGTQATDNQGWFSVTTNGTMMAPRGGFLYFDSNGPAGQTSNSVVYQAAGTNPDGMAIILFELKAAH